MKNSVLKIKLLITIVATVFVLGCTKDGDVGPIGPAGAQGIQGPEGPQGPAGEDGTNGTDGEDGTNGTDGEDGTNGTDGEDGTNGTDGEDGNANVRVFTYDLSNFSGSFYDQHIPELNSNVVEHDVVLGYLKSHIDRYHPIPGASLYLLGGHRVDVLVSIRTRLYSLDFYTVDTVINYNIPMGGIKLLKVVIIESSSGTSGKSGKAQILTELNTRGVDVNDYHQVMDYFGLDN